jgi:putative salt-induced outer membrane protein YdiY
MNIAKQLKPVVLASSLLVSPLALANQFFLGSPATSDAEGTAVEEPAGWSASIEFGYVATTGNNETESTNGRLNLGHEGYDWRHAAFIAVQGNSIETTDSGVTTTTSTENYNAGLKSDYKINAKAYGFGLIEYDQIDNSGFDYQSSAVVGMGYSFIKDDVHTLDGEIGYGIRKSKITDGDTDSENVVRVSGAYKRALSENSSFEQLIVSEIGDDNTITTSLTSLSANLVENLAMKFSYEFRKQSDAPEGFEDKDTTTSFTVVYTF